MPKQIVIPQQVEHDAITITVVVEGLDDKYSLKQLTITKDMWNMISFEKKTALSDAIQTIGEELAKELSEKGVL